MLDGEFWILMLKILVFLPVVLSLLYMSIKYGGSKLQKIQNGKYMKVLDRLPLSKDNSIMVVKIGEKAYTVSSTVGKIDILFELPEEELHNIEAYQIVPEYENVKEIFQKLIKKKEVKDEDKK